VVADDTNQPRIEKSDTPVTEETVFTWSCFVKAGTSDFVALTTYASEGGSAARWNISTGEFLASTGTMFTASSIEAYSDGWYRCSLTTTYEANASNNLWKINLINGSSMSTGVVNEYIYVWGAQLEKASSASAYIPTTGLIATDATLTANPYNAGYDVVGNALKLRGEGLHLDGKGWAVVPDDASIDLTTEYGLECWVKFYDFGSTYNILQKKSNWQYSGYGIYRHTNGQLIVEHSTTDAVGDVEQTGITGVDALDTWFHIAVVKTTTHVLIYIDGALAASPADGEDSAANAVELIIGQGVGGSRNSSLNFRGIIDDVKIYNTPLAPAGTTDIPTITAKVLNNYKVGKSKHS
tara:strand:- start:488 stop:1543 length:1056 start_codon:yes stop_codon:yes gene_type:complete